MKGENIQRFRVLISPGEQLTGYTLRRRRDLKSRNWLCGDKPLRDVGASCLNAVRRVYLNSSRDLKSEDRQNTFRRYSIPDMVLVLLRTVCSVHLDDDP